MTASISTIIPTLNEAEHISGCIASVLDLGPVFVVDCGSDDGTQQRAAAAGATVVHQDWLGHANQKNWALDNLPLTTPWVLFLDADETVPPELARELKGISESVDGTAGYYVARRNIFLGQELRYAWWYPDYQMRFFKRGLARYESRAVHEHMVVEGDTNYLKVALIHENRHGIEAFLARHVRYAKLESQSQNAEPDLRELPLRLAARRWVKVRLWAPLRGKPAIRFIWMYIIRGGFRDGEVGRIYCQLIASYEAMIEAFALERQRGLERVE